jgi:hypothetical protein
MPLPNPSPKREGKNNIMLVSYSFFPGRRGKANKKFPADFADLRRSGCSNLRKSARTAGKRIKKIILLFGIVFCYGCITR